MSHLVGVRVYQEYQWNYLGLRHIAVHGHQFDTFVVKNVRLNYWFGTLLYLQLQKWDTKSKALTRFLDRLGTRWQRLSEKVADGALAHAKHHDAARIFCGTLMRRSIGAAMDAITTIAAPGSMSV